VICVGSKVGGLRSKAFHNLKSIYSEYEGGRLDDISTTRFGGCAGWPELQSATGLTLVTSCVDLKLVISVVVSATEEP